MKQPLHIHAVLLAAGESRRFNGIKQLAEIPYTANCIDEPKATKGEHKTQRLIANACLQIQEADFDSQVAILGANADVIEPHIHSSIPKQIYSDWSLGMGTTIAYAMSTLPKHATHVCIALADQVRLSAADYNQLINTAKVHTNKIISAYFNNRLGAPCIFPEKYFAQLTLLAGDAGARYILKQESDSVHKVPLALAAFDIDTKDDLTRLFG